MMLVVSVISLLIADKNIETVSKLDSIKVYGDISTELTRLALFVRSIDHSNYYKAEPFYSVESIKLAVDNLQALKLSLKDKKSNLLFCENFDMFSENNIHEKKNSSHYEHINLFNYITNTQNQVTFI